MEDSRPCGFHSALLTDTKRGVMSAGPEFLPHIGPSPLAPVPSRLPAAARVYSIGPPPRPSGVQYLPTVPTYCPIPLGRGLHLGRDSHQPPTSWPLHFRCHRTRPLLPLPPKLTAMYSHPPSIRNVKELQVVESNNIQPRAPTTSTASADWFSPLAWRGG